MHDSARLDSRANFGLERPPKSITVEGREKGGLGCRAEDAVSPTKGLRLCCCQKLEMSIKLTWGAPKCQGRRLIVAQDICSLENRSKLKSLLLFIIPPSYSSGGTCAAQVADPGHHRSWAFAGRTGASGSAFGDDSGDKGNPNRAAVWEAAEPAQASDSFILLGATHDERLRHHFRHRQHLCVWPLTPSLILSYYAILYTHISHAQLLALLVATNMCCLLPRYALTCWTSSTAWCP